MNRHRHYRGVASRRAGTILSEMLFVMPLLLVILSLLFYIGMTVVRAQHASVMARYETWRDEADAPGPFWNPGHENNPGSATLLNEAFYAGQAQSITHYRNNRGFTEETLDALIEAAGRYSGEASQLAEDIHFRPPNGDPRKPHGHREGFVVQHEVDVPLWRKVHGPIRRQHVRMESNWPHVRDWRAGPDIWESTQGPNLHHLRGVRDTFFLSFDEALDEIDLERDAEYSDYPGGPQSPNNAHLAGAIRRMYLHEPPYRGPIVHDELEGEGGSGF